MKSSVFTALFLTLGAVLPATAAPAPPKSAVETADRAFQKGNFQAAHAAYSQVIMGKPADFRATTRLGYLALLGNHFAEAEKWLNRARKLNPGSPVPAGLLAEAAYRQDEFARAAPLFRSAGDGTKAEQLASFAGQTPYQTTMPQKAATLKFVVTDPLPVVQVSVNGSAPVNFFIDTGASELTLDTNFARRVGARLFGSSTGTFAGGKQAPFSLGRVDKVTLGGMGIRNVPVVVMPVRPLSQIFDGMPIDGIIGTVFLYHFLTTLDYPRGRLLLRPKDHSTESAGAHEEAVIPFWMAGDHFMAAHGTINGGPSRLFFVDTGLAGGGFSAPQETLTEAGITLDDSKAGQGLGGGGHVEVIPFTVDTLTLGSATQRHVPGYFTGPFAFSDTFGFRLSGLISHRFFRPYAFTMDFTKMRYYLKSGTDGETGRQKFRQP